MFLFKLNKARKSNIPILIKRLPNKPYEKVRALFKCKINKKDGSICDNIFECLEASVKSKRTKSCGCLKKDSNSIGLKTKHGHKTSRGASPTYLTWTNMLRRCNNPKNKFYKNYGGRGITVDPRWFKFENFLKDMGEKPNKRLTIERIDNNGNYELSNCKWADRTVQAHNKRNNVLVEINKQLLPIEAARKLSGTTLSIQAVTARMKKGLSFEQALKVKQMYRYVVYNNQEMSVAEACRQSKTDWTPSMVITKLNQGMAFEEIITSPRKRKRK